MALSARTLCRSSVRTLTKRFHARVWRTLVSLASDVKYAARPVTVEFAVKWPVLGPSVCVPFVTLAENEANGSVDSSLGDAIGVLAEEVLVLDCAVEAGREEAAWRAAVLLEGEARRESVLRKVDFLFGGGVGTVDASSGNLGSFLPGRASLSFSCASTISVAVRVRVRLWVGAGGRGPISIVKGAGTRPRRGEELTLDIQTV